MIKNNFLKISVGYIVLYGAFEILSRLFESNINLLYASIIFVIVLIIGAAIEKLFFRSDNVFIKLGFGKPVCKAVGVAAVISIVLFLFYPIISAITGYKFIFSVSMIPLQIGVFISHGLIEEMIYRGFLFRHLREEGRSFWKAAFVALPFFAAAHVPLIVSQGVLVGGTAFLLAVASSFPLAYLYEKGGNTIWAPAIVHFAIDTVIPILSVGEFNSQGQMSSVYWMLASMIVPYIAFVLLKEKSKTENLPQSH